ncbi:GNAT family N-acetyltransferase [Sphingomonas sp. BGYR3]|uniref:GNAT family N-acetyltransferase n=1 Tax=Sphingomonas sp. BGYR3 TaxID=2975483 RepID=UPI0021A5D725|nr:GNAT family N-acetyltransferase [Sphingomonas sp. BGYR3]MDG5488153.1 GNAT family N-acetyltransferase [Sphingomonas sp. BGYR3]
MTVHLRDATPDDAATLAALARDSFTETFGHLYHPDDLALFLAGHSAERWLGELTDPAFRVRMGQADGRAVAYAKLGPPSLPFEARGPSIELRQLYVLKPWQGTGLAADLMQWAIDTARGTAAQDLYLSVFTDNHRARRFYARYGFDEVGPYVFKVGNHEDADIVLRLAL